LMVSTSLRLSLIFSDNLFFMGGGFGYFINAAISNYVGGIGLIALLLFSMLSFLVLSVNLSFSLPSRNNSAEGEALEDETNANFASAPNYNDSHNTANEVK